jgi:hypothetical protein
MHKYRLIPEQALVFLVYATSSKTYGRFDTNHVFLALCFSTLQALQLDTVIKVEINCKSSLQQRISKLNDITDEELLEVKKLIETPGCCA